MEKRLIVFFDLLGFSSIIRSTTDADAKKQEKILTLLSELARSEGDFAYTTTPVDANTTEHSLKPAISAFSDSIIYSFPLDKLEPFGSDPIVFYLAQQASAIFRNALSLGCLIRGGISIGLLYHEKQVVFGPGLVEAYELESKYARMPRILISDSALEIIRLHPFVRNDEDGSFILDYLSASYEDAVKIERINSEEGFAQGWFAHVERIFNETIASLSPTNIAALQNWRWTLAQWKRLSKP